MGAKFPYYLLADSTEGRAKEQAAHRQAVAAGAGDRRHPARVRLRAGAAHHAEVDREQPRHRRRHEPRRDRRGDQAARRLRDCSTTSPTRTSTKVRVTGPFTVESLSPAPLACLRRRGRGRPRLGDRGGGRARTPTRRASSRSILDNLAQGRHPERPTQRAHRVRLPRALRRAPIVQAIGERAADAEDAPTSPDRHGDRPAVRHGQPVVHQGRREGGDPRRGRRPALPCWASRSTRRPPGSPSPTE